MLPSFVPAKLLLSKDWLSSEDLTEEIVSPSIKAALQVPGLLTLALQDVYEEPVSVECVRQSVGPSDQNAAQEPPGLRRDVILKAGNTPCVTASTLMPSSVLKLHPWLGKLGNKPLGESLEQRVPHRRGEFEFAQVDLHLTFPLEPPSVHFIWARRYRFSLEGGDLLVTEIFLPGVLGRLAQGLAFTPQVSV